MKKVTIDELARSLRRTPRYILHDLWRFRLLPAVEERGTEWVHVWDEEAVMDIYCHRDDIISMPYWCTANDIAHIVHLPKSKLPDLSRLESVTKEHSVYYRMTSDAWKYICE